MQRLNRLEIVLYRAGMLAAYLLIFVSARCYTQVNELSITESFSAEVCGKTIYIDAIWMNEGIMTADISVLDQPNSKPITGGYRKGDELVISTDDGCTYYIFSISKSGLDGTKGKITLSKFPPVSPVQLCEDTLIWNVGSRYAVDSLDWKITSIRKNSKDKLVAYVKELYSSKNLKKFKLKKNNMVWLGECLFQVTSVKSGSGEGKIVLAKVTSYFYTPGLFIKEGELNKPNFK